MSFVASSDCKNFGCDTLTAIKEADNEEAKSNAIEFEVFSPKSLFTSIPIVLYGYVDLEKSTGVLVLLDMFINDLIFAFDIPSSIG